MDKGRELPGPKANRLMVVDRANESAKKKEKKEEEKRE